MVACTNSNSTLVLSGNILPMRPIQLIDSGTEHEILRTKSPFPSLI